MDKAVETYAPLKSSNPSLYKKLCERVLVENVCVRWMILTNYEFYYDITNAKTYLGELDAWAADAKVVGAAYYGEARSVTAWLTAARAKV